MRSIGDLASLMMTNRRQSTLQGNMNSSAQTATTGIAGDKARHLVGDTTSLALMDRKMELLKQYQNNISDVRVMVSSIQSSLENISQNSEAFLNSLSLSSQIDAPSELEIFSAQASSAFIDMVRTLNTKISGRYIFSGTEISVRPLPGGSDILQKLKGDLTGLTTAAAISDAVDNWFDTPVGPYQSTLYQGSVSRVVDFPIDVDTTVQANVRANDPAILDNLKSLAKSALAAEADASLSIVEQKTLFSESYNLLLKSTAQLQEKQSLVGIVESIIKETSDQNEASLIRLEREQFASLKIDQFQSVTNFEALQQQLDISYRIAARQSQTSLAEYLR